MNWVKCGRDGLECDLNPVRGTCRHLDGHKKVNGILQSWSGQCFDRVEASGSKPTKASPAAQADHGMGSLGP